MTKKCCVPECNSNYRTSSESYVSVFKFPCDEALRAKWIENIPRSNWTPARHAVVCIKHFADCDISFSEKYVDPDGNVKEWKRMRPVLKESAVPTIFSELLSNCSKQTTLKRKYPPKRGTKNEEPQKKTCRTQKVAERN